jgi:signal transduction histidine kinase
MSIVLTYIAVAAAWIILSDRLLGGAGPNTVLISTAKGLAFVAATSSLLWLLLGRWSARLSKMEEVTRDREHELAAIYETAPSFMLLVDRERRIRKANKKVPQASGEDLGTQMLGPNYGLTLRCVLALESPSGCEATPSCANCVIRLAILDAIGRGREVTQIEASIPRLSAGAAAPGAATFLLSTATLEVRGEPMVLVTATDITAQKRAEAELRSANADLQDADRRKDDFLAVLSHELRNPLAPIRNSLYVLERSAAGTEPHRSAQAILDRQVDHLTHLVDDLLDVTRVTRGKIQLRPTAVDLRQIVERTTADHRSLFTTKGVELEVNIGSRPRPVHGDAARLTQAIGNLLSNAAKFTPERGTVRVGLEQRGASAILTVEDTGIGFDPVIASRLFEPYMQAESTRDPGRTGLGLGLSVVKSLVELHRGTVRASSAGRGKGATFVITLPIDDRPPTQAEEESPSRPSPRGRTRHVLVVEDNSDAGASLAEVLQLLGFEVTLAATGVQALEMVAVTRPDVVLCDIGLPGMDGYEVAKAVRRDEGMAGVRLVALSGFASPDDVEQAMQAGFDEHLAKPPDLQALQRALG